ncbi:MAG: antitoxin protein [Pseudomonadota bacterium]
MYNPPHPGLLIKENILPALGLGVTEVAHQLGVTPTALLMYLTVGLPFR